MFILSGDMLSNVFTLYGLLLIGDGIILFMDSFILEMRYVFFYNELEVNMCLFQSESYMYLQCEILHMNSTQ